VALDDDQRYALIKLGDSEKPSHNPISSDDKEAIVSEKKQFEMLPAEMPKWIRDHVELYLSDPEKAHLWDSTIGGGPGPLPTLLLIARGAKSGKLRPLPLLYQEMDGSTSSSARRAARLRIRAGT